MSCSITRHRPATRSRTAQQSKQHSDLSFPNRIHHSPQKYYVYMTTQGPVSEKLTRNLCFFSLDEMSKIKSNAAS